MTHSEAEKAVADNSYKSATDDRLRAMWKACMGASGPNQNAIARIRKVADIIREEMTAREISRRQLPVISASAGSNVQNSITPTTPAPTWDEAKLFALIADQIEESFNLEYKSAGAISRETKAKTEITKDVSALANSGGGTIIYGMAEFSDMARKHLPEKIDPADRTNFSKEWLENIIAQIKPRISDLRIHPVQLASGANDVAYVVEVPQGTTAHQAADFRYYRRYNFEAVPMLDHEVKDVMNRAKQPRIVVRAKLVIYDRTSPEGKSGRLIFYLDNNSDVFARFTVLVANVPFLINGKPVSYGAPTSETTAWGLGYQLIFSNHSDAPLFPRSRLHPWFEFAFLKKMEHVPEKLSDRYSFLVFADSMPPVQGVFTFDEIFQATPAKTLLVPKP